ncbi:MULTISPECIES: hypothetical protein [Vibrio]|uniref:Flagellar motor protein MotA n=1 Tax=Vibrio vulnificus TaxID=672 RepID=A0AAW4HA68_VIBVL|nr:MULTISPECIES: hypothetical protein [Vibrio]EGQ8000412.1 hypothetical protein [Vibrio vulnificus]EIV1853529.1 hypothetical protein [Vibrio vulnificus]EJV2650338.1 hypothetical protein [Vibrio vulnificus]ELI0608369.1 hypothetical protein [Vibrio vulnificus]ELX4139123.1 hypothetical protein [Vibrio vulnificus]
MFRVLLLFLVLLSASVNADSEELNHLKAKVMQNQEQGILLNKLVGEVGRLKEEQAENSSLVMRSIGEVETASKEQVHELNQRVEQIKEQLEAIDVSLNALKTQGVNESLGMNFSVWTGILLASVSAIVTTLGVVIAIGSIFGYKKIMDSSRGEAERVAKEEANKVAKEEVAERIERGEFNSLVIEAVDRVAFGNINSNDELDDEERGSAQ